MQAMREKLTSGGDSFELLGHHSSISSDGDEDEEMTCGTSMNKRDQATINRIRRGSK